MKITPLSSPFSFSVDTTFGNITINETGNNISLFLKEQEKDIEKTFHWPGEYEMGGIAIFIKNSGGEKNIGKIFVEQVRVVFCTDEGVTSAEDIVSAIGNTDVLIFKKGENGLSESQVKKLIEDIDPQLLVASGIETKDLFKKMALPLIGKENISFTKKSLPQEHTEYYSL